MIDGRTETIAEIIVGSACTREVNSVTPSWIIWFRFAVMKLIIALMIWGNAALIALQMAGILSTNAPINRVPACATLLVPCRSRSEIELISSGRRVPILEMISGSFSISDDRRFIPTTANVSYFVMK